MTLYIYGNINKTKIHLHDLLLTLLRIFKVPAEIEHEQLYQIIWYSTSVCRNTNASTQLHELRWFDGPRIIHHSQIRSQFQSSDADTTMELNAMLLLFIRRWLFVTRTKIAWLKSTINDTFSKIKLVHFFLKKTWFLFLYVISKVVINSAASVAYSHLRRNAEVFRSEMSNSVNHNHNYNDHPLCSR